MKKIIYLSLLILAAGTSKAQINENSAIKLINFTANEKNEKVFVNWATDGAVATNYFEVQRSVDGKAFKTVALILGPDPEQQGDRYQYVEKLKVKNNTTVYYRLRHVDNNGEEQVTEIITAAK